MNYFVFFIIASFGGGLFLWNKKPYVRHLGVLFMCAVLVFIYYFFDKL